MDNLIKRYKSADDFLILFFSIILLIFTLIMNAHVHKPEKLIEDYLVKQNYQQINISIKKISPNEYILLNPPRDRITNVPFERWKIEPLGKFVYYARPIGMPPTKIINMKLELTQDDYALLKLQADQHGMSIDDYLQNSVLNLIK